VAEDEGDLLLGADIGKPAPDEHALDRDNDILPVGCDSQKKSLQCDFAVPVQKDFPLLVQDADVRGSGMRIDPAVVPVLFWYGTSLGFLLMFKDGRSDNPILVDHGRRP
jgi:hypothetical protein